MDLRASLAVCGLWTATDALAPTPGWGACALRPAAAAIPASPNGSPLSADGPLSYGPDLPGDRRLPDLSPTVGPQGRGTSTVDRGALLDRAQYRTCLAGVVLALLLATPVAAQTVKAITVAVLPYDWVDDGRHTMSLTDIDASMQGLEAFYEGNTWHLLDIQPFVPGQYFTLPFGFSCPDVLTLLDSWMPQIDQFAADVGFPAAPVQKRIYTHTNQLCGSTWAQLAGTRAHLSGHLGPVFHEFGHLLGLEHARTRTCHEDNGGAYVPNRGPGIICGEDEYGHPYNHMAVSVGPLTAPQLRGLNLLPVSRIGLAHYALGQDFTFTISPIEAVTTSYQAVQITPSGAGSADVWWLEFHRDGEWDVWAAGSPWLTGVAVYQGNGSRAALLDMTPDGDFRDAPMLAGTSYLDPGGLKISVLSVEPGAQATVRVQFGVTEARPAAPGKPIIS